MVKINVHLDSKDVERKLGEFVHKTPNAIASTLNRTMTQVVKEVNTGIKDNYTIKKELRSSIKRVRAGTKKLSASTFVKGRTLPIEKFKMKLSKGDVRAEVKKGNVKNILNSFVTNLHGEKVFKRTTKKRLPISRVHSVSVPQMADDEKIVNSALGRGVIEFEKNLNIVINNMIDKLNKQL